MSTFRSLYAGPDDGDKNMKFRVPFLYFFSSVLVVVSMAYSMLVPSGLFVVRVGMWACMVLMSLFATFLFLFSLADVQRYDPERMSKHESNKTEGKLKRIATISAARRTRLVAGLAQRDTHLNKCIWISVFAGLLVSYLPFLSDGSCLVLQDDGIAESQTFQQSQH